MNTFTFDGSWNKIKGTLKQKYAQLTDDDLLFVEGKSGELLGRLQTKLGLSEHGVTVLLAEIKGSATNFAGNVREKVGEFVGDVKARVSDVSARVGEAVGDAKDKVAGVAGEAYDHARQSVRTLQGRAEDYVIQQPVQALLTALAVGFVAGLLIRRH